MKKKRKKSPSSKKSAPSSPTTERVSRRAFLSRSVKFGLGAFMLAGGTIFGVSAVRATVHEQDVSRVGQGVPSIVQIHDPNCSLCNALQKETRKALKAVGPGRLDYIVANIRTNEGSRFAASHGQPHVTLMLMDPAGNPVHILNGPQDRDDLTRIFAEHADAYPTTN